MQSPPFGIIGINNNNLRHTTNPPSKQGQGQGQQQLVPIPVTNPTNRVGRHGGEGGEQGEQGKQSSGGAKKTRAFMGDSPHPHRPNEPDATLPARPNDVANNDNVFADTLRTLQDEVESSGEKEAVVAAPATKKREASNPYRPGCCRTLLFSSLRHNYLKDLPRAPPFSSRSGCHKQQRKKKLGKSSRHSTW